MRGKSDKEQRSSKRIADAHRAPRPDLLGFWLATLGFGCYFAWMMIGITPSIFSEPSVHVLELFNSSESQGKLLGIVPLAVVGLVVFKKHEALSSSKKHAQLAIAVGALVSLATFAAYALDSFAIDVTPLPIALSVLFVAVWGEFLCSMQARRAMFCIVGAHAVGFALTILDAALPSTIQIPLHILFPLISGILFFRMKKQPEYLPVVKGCAAPPSSLIRLLLGIGCLGVIMQFLFLFTEGKTVAPNELLWVVAGLSVCLAIVLVGAIAPREPDIPFASRLILPLFVLGEFLIFAFDFDQKPIEVFAIGAAWMYYRFFYLIMWRTGALRSSLPAFCVFALGQIILTFGCFVGGVLYSFAASLEISGFLILAIVCIAVILVSLFVFDSQYLSGYVGQQKRMFDAGNRALCELCVDKATVAFGLSRQERVIALMLAQGKTNDDIQNELVIAYNTLRTHLRNMYKKTDTHSREELVILIRSLV